ncbi:hypothetical protein OG979_13890 [Actinomadura citrea]|uniref:alpha/beta fold hydrolase n=1 Tax=Actinomadura citrea TaxID=46158 RepID=UPI002E2A5D5A|nr:hypothetical protein [Actinomadura citrea]
MTAFRRLRIWSVDPDKAMSLPGDGQDDRVEGEIAPEETVEVGYWVRVEKVLVDGRITVFVNPGDRYGTAKSVSRALWALFLATRWVAGLVPLLLIQGLALDHHGWDSADGDFDDRPVIVMDHCGTGASDDHFPDAWSMSGFAWDAVSVLDAAGIQRAPYLLGRERAAARGRAQLLGRARQMLTMPADGRWRGPAEVLRSAPEPRRFRSCSRPVATPRTSPRLRHGPGGPVPAE